MRQTQTGSPPQFPTFSLAERDRRWGLVQQLLQQEGLDALVVIGDRDGVGQPLFTADTWLTNDRMGHVVIVPRGGEPAALVGVHLMIGDNIEAHLRGDSTWLTPDNLYTASVRGSAAMSGGRGGAAIAEFLQKRGLSAGRIGIVGLEPTLYCPDGALPYGTFKAMLDGCPQATFVPVWQKLVALMLPRSKEEVVALRLSGHAGERMCEAMIELARPGVWEHELYAAAMEACFLAGGVSSWLILVTGPDGQNVSWSPPPWTYRAQPPRRIQSGDVILAELFPLYGMIETQQQLTITVGDVHPDVERAYSAARAAYEAGLKTARPGVTFGEVVTAMNAPVKDIGGWNLTPHVHSVNPLALHGNCDLSASVPGVERYRTLAGVPMRGGETVLQTGMSFAFEPNCVLGKRRVNIGGSVVVTETGVEELNSLPNFMHRL